MHVAHYELTCCSAHGHNRAQTLMLLLGILPLQSRSPTLHSGHKLLSSMLPEKGSIRDRKGQITIQQPSGHRDCDRRCFKASPPLTNFTCRPSAVSKPRRSSSQSASMGRPRSHNSPFTVLTKAPLTLFKE